MFRKVLMLLLATLLSGCLGLPTIEVTASPLPITIPTTLPPTATVTNTPAIIKITGDVYVRDEQGNVIGWLYNADQVHATCSGDWCRIFSGSYAGYSFWRGCSSDNAERRTCQAK